jgi:hypothetical protein
MAHGKRLTHYKRKEKSAVRGKLSRPLNIESLDLKGKLPKKYLSDMKRIWRLSGVGHSDLVLVERITRKPPKEKALYPICVAIVTSGLVEAITTTPKRKRRVAEYVRQHSDLVTTIQQQKRYVRLKTPEAKARLLWLGLANPTISLTYAERSKAKSRDFRKDQRAIRYAKKRSV